MRRTKIPPTRVFPIEASFLGLPGLIMRIADLQHSGLGLRANAPVHPLQSVFGICRPNRFPLQLEDRHHQVSGLRKFGRATLYSIVHHALEVEDHLAS